MSIDSLPNHINSDSVEPLVIDVPGFPPPSHPVEADVFARHVGLRGHDQEALRKATVLIGGCGGLGSWTALALARMGVGHLVLCDPDSYDRTNVPRQLMFPADIGVNKAHALARNIVPHMADSGRVTAIATTLQDASDLHRPDLLLVLTDNNQSRLSASEDANQLGIPAIFAMLANDGAAVGRLFLQAPRGACLVCAVPDLDASARARCVPASIGPCLVVAGVIGCWAREILSRRLLRVNWCCFSLESTGTSTGYVERRLDCLACGPSRRAF